MNKRVVMLVLLLTVFVLLTGCQNIPESANSTPVKEEAQETKEVQKDISNLLCFQCHSFAEFNTVFPHDSHRAMGLHCTQCHIIEGHKMAKLNGDTCNNCHNLEHMKLSITSMPASFNHQFHAQMFECKDCHNKKAFPMKLNSKKITMMDLQEGKYCGKCHNGQMAFASSECQKCHQM
jgi:c(7)-type cytochrome triheme protein